MTDKLSSLVNLPTGRDGKGLTVLSSIFRCFSTSRKILKKIVGNIEGRKIAGADEGLDRGGGRKGNWGVGTRGGSRGPSDTKWHG